MRNKIADYLEKDGVKYSYQGFRLLVDAIEMASKMGMEIRICEIYNALAFKYGTTTARVDRNIRHAIDSAGYTVNNKEYVAKAVFQLEQMGNGHDQTL